MMYWGYPEDVAGLNPLELSGQRLALNNIWIPIIRTLHVDAGKVFTLSIRIALLAAWAGAEAGLRNSGRGQAWYCRHNRARTVSASAK